MIRIIQVIFIAIPCAIFSYLLVQEFVPTGTFAVPYAVGEQSPFIDRLLPDARVQPVRTDLDGDTVQAVIDDPAFFFVHPHRSFDTVEMEVWFKNNGVPIVEMGGLANVEADAYDLHPLQNTIIDASDWHRLTEEGITLLQREPVYTSIETFLADPPARSEIATYHYALTEPYRLNGYVPSSTSQMIYVSLRGFHEFKTYIKDETLSFDFAYMDMNRDEGADTIYVLVTDENGTLVTEARASDDGNTSSNAQPSAMKHVRVTAPNLPEGVYKVELRVGRDVFFRTITTSQQKIVFLNNVYLGDEIAYHEPAWPVQFWTEGKHLAFTTQHAEGVQDVRVGASSVSVSAPYARTPVDVQEDGVVKILVPRADMIVNTDGHIAFAPEQYFNPDPVRLMYNTDLDRLGVNYVIAEYTPPETIGNWTVARTTFDTNVLVLNEKSWKFVFSTPGIRELGAHLDVGRIDMTWKRPPLTWSEFVAMIKRQL